MKKIMVVGHAALPQGSALKSVYENLALAVVIEPRYGVILKANINLASDLAEDFVAQIVIGHSLYDEVDELIAEIKETYRGTLANALSAAVKDLKRVFLTMDQSSQSRR